LALRRPGTNRGPPQELRLRIWNPEVSLLSFPLEAVQIEPGYARNRWETSQDLRLRTSDPEHFPLRREDRGKRGFRRGRLGYIYKVHV